MARQRIENAMPAGPVSHQLDASFSVRASLGDTDQIVEFDSDGNMTVVLDAGDGITGPGGGNNLAYDVQGNFYVAVSSPRNAVLRFPVGGGPRTVFVDQSDGAGGGRGAGVRRRRRPVLRPPNVRR